MSNPDFDKYKTDEPNLDTFEEVIQDYLPDFQKEQSSKKDLEYALRLIEEYNRRASISGYKKWFIPGTPYSIDKCPKHMEFFKAGAVYPERLFMAANRAGKSIAGAYETALHALGEYPEWWEGRRFDHPTSLWCAGKTGQTTRDTIQKELFGEPGSFGMGMIPADKIVKPYTKQGIANALDTVVVKHASGGTSTIGFKSYDQGIQAFYGTAKHVIWLDEECPENVYNECLIRTMTTGGIVYVTFTPLHGITPFIFNFCDNCDYLAGSQRITLPPKDEEE